MTQNTAQSVSFKLTKHSKKKFTSIFNIFFPSKEKNKEYFSICYRRPKLLGPHTQRHHKKMTDQQPLFLKKRNKNT